MTLEHALILAVVALTAAVGGLWKVVWGILKDSKAQLKACQDSRDEAAEKHEKVVRDLIARNDKQMADAVSRIRSLEDSRSTEMRDLAVKVTTTLAHNAQAIADLTSAVRTMRRTGSSDSIPAPHDFTPHGQ